jgi:hypothetical protein
MITTSGEKPEYFAVVKGGKNPSGRGSANNSGSVIHYVTEKDSGFWGTPALCGDQPSYSGYGWLGVEKKATCKKCLKLTLWNQERNKD